MSGALFLLFAVLQVVGYETTTGILARGGRELNPLVRWLIAHCGLPGLLLAKLIALALGFALYRTDATPMLGGLCAVYVGICGWNWRQGCR